MTAKRKKMRAAVIIAALILPVYQQAYWWTTGCANEDNWFPTLVWFGICVAVCFLAGYHFVPVRNED